MDQIGPFGQVVTLVHFVSEVSAPPIGGEGAPTAQWRIACMPHMAEFHRTPYHPNYQRTDDPRAVTCPQCCKSQVFVRANNDLARRPKRRA